MKKYYYLLIVGVLFQSCSQKNLTDILPFEGQKLVIEGFITVNKSVEVLVYSTLSPVGDLTDERFVTTATVHLFEDSILVETLQHDGDGLYISPNGFRPKFGKAYYLEVTAPDFPKAVSKPEMLPDSVPVFTWDFTDSLFIDNNTIEGRLAFEFQDIVNEANFYGITIEAVYDGERSSISSLKEAFNVANPDCELFTGDYLKDKCFENNQFSYDFITNCRRYGEIGSRDLRYHQLRLTLKTVAKSHYDYHYFLFINNNNDGNPFAEPTEVYTNIEGGYGVFTTYLERVVIVNL